MRLLKLASPFVLVAGIGALLIGGPAHGQSATASIVAVDSPALHWSTAAGDAPTVTIAPGGTVDFSYPVGTTKHNVVFTGATQPTCVQTAGTSAGSVPPLPNPSSAGAPGWAGTCTFAAAGVYPFICGIHNYMTGTVTVAAAGSTPPSPAPPPPPATTPPPPPAAVPPSPSPPVVAPGPAASNLKLAVRQHGATIRGSLKIASAKSRMLARAFVQRKTLNGGSSVAAVLVGRQVRTSAGPGVVTLAIDVNALLRRTIAHRGKALITVKITVTPPVGRAYSATRSVILRAT